MEQAHFLNKVTIWAGVGVVAVVFLFRLHAIRFNEEIMVDESMFLADAMRANATSYVPWHRYDSITSGPLNTLPLALLLKAGAPANYHFLHTFAAAVTAASFLLVLILAGRLAGPGPGAAIGLGGAAIFALQTAPDFSHYSSGLIPFLLLAGGWAVGLRRTAEGECGPVAGRVFWSALLFAMAPLAKSQAAVPGLACWLGLAGWIGWQSVREGKGAPWGAWMRMVAGGALPPLVTLAAVGMAGALPYVIGSFTALSGYAGRQEPGAIGKDVVWLILNSESRFLFAALGGAAIVLLLAGWGTFRPKGSGVAVAVMGAWLGSALLAAALPQTMAGIYQVFLYGPALLALAALVRWVGADPRGTGLIATAFLAAAGAMLGPALKRNFAKGQPAPTALPMEAENRTSAVLRQLGAPGQWLFVWGWAPSVYVHTGMIPAARFSFAQPATRRYFEGPVFRDALMADLREHPPEFIVDAMQSGFGMNTLGTYIGFYDPSRDLTAQEFYPELVKMGYRWCEDVSLPDGSASKIYRRHLDAR